jgi:hypothetical protein
MAKQDSQILGAIKQNGYKQDSQNLGAIKQNVYKQDSPLVLLLPEFGSPA